MELKFDDKKVVGTAVLKHELTESDIETIMVGGIEGGIGYWAVLHIDKDEFADKPKGEPISTWATKILIDGKSITFTDAEEEEEEEWVLTLEKLVKGFELNALNRKWDSDIENGDASTYDCIIQYALFGKLVYG